MSWLIRLGPPIMAPAGPVVVVCVIAPSGAWVVRVSWTTCPLAARATTKARPKTSVLVRIMRSLLNL